MRRIEYNKLVRDKIPERLEKTVKCFSTRVVEGDEYYKSLNNKLQEEVNEYFESGSIEELADIQEVLLAILDFKNVKLDEFEQIRLDKVQERGVFKQKIFLEYVEE